MTKYVSPWYNCPGWLGVKHQFTYLLTFLVIRFEPSGDFLTVLVYVCLPTFLVMCFELTGDFLTVLVYVYFQLQNLAGSVDTLASKVYWGRGGGEGGCYIVQKKTFVTGSK